MIKILDTPGFLLTKSTAKILRLTASMDLVEPCLKEAVRTRDEGKFVLSKGYDKDGKSITLSREQRGTHQAFVGYDVFPLNQWLNPHVHQYSIDNFFSEGKRIVKTQDYYLWYDAGIGISLHADDSTYGSADFHRVITVLVYLNSDYVGGEIHFPEHDIKLKPAPGDVLIFPSNRMFKHQVLPIVSGERFAIMQTWNIVSA
jgi:hypothetical protein